MWNSQPVHVDDDDDDAPPPGFGPNRFEDMMAGGDRGPASDQYMPVPQQHHRQLHHQQHWQSPSPDPYCSVKQGPPASGATAGGRSSSSHRAAGSTGATSPAVGAARQFQRALTSSLGERKDSLHSAAAAATPAGPGRLRQPPGMHQQQLQQPQQKQQEQQQEQQQQPQQRHASPLPDYGDYNDDDDDYGASSSSRRNNSSRKHPAGGSSSRPCSASNLPASRSYGNLSVSSAHSQHSLHSQASPLRSAQGTSPRPAPNVTADSRPPAAYQQQQSPKPQQRQEQQQLARTPTPDYGDYEDSDDYGSSSSRRRRGATPRPGPAAGAAPHAGSALAAANQALAGIPAVPVKRPTRRAGQRNRSMAGGRAAAAAGGSPGGAKLSTEHAAQLEAELAALRSALAEAEERQVEAQMVVLTLETDNTTLQAQLEGMRVQKQQLETMLLFGGGDGKEGEQYEPYPYNDEDEDDEDYASEDDEAETVGNAAAAAALPEQQQQDGASEPGAATSPPQMKAAARFSWADDADAAELQEAEDLPPVAGLAGITELAGEGLPPLNSSGGSLGQRWQLPDSSLPPGAADVLEAEEELRRLGLLPPAQAAAGQSAGDAAAGEAEGAALEAGGGADAGTADKGATGDAAGESAGEVVEAAEPSGPGGGVESRQ